RRHAEIGERAVDGVNAARVEHARHRSIVGVDQLDTVAESRQRRARDAERRRIAIETDQARGTTLANCSRVSPDADGTVDQQTAAFGLEVAERLRGQHGKVSAQIPNSERARASSSVYGSRCSFSRNRSWFHTSR